MKENKKFSVTKKVFFGMFSKNFYRTVKQGLDKMLEVPKDKKTLVEIRHLDVTYGRGKYKNKAVKDLSLNIYDGEILGLVGESGSGKSTTGSALVGMIDHSFGQIKIADKTLPMKSTKIKGELEKFLVNKVQMIFQDPSNSLNPYKNVEDVIGEGLENMKKKSKNLFIYNYDQKILKTLLQELEVLKNQDDLILDITVQEKKMTLDKNEESLEYLNKLLLKLKKSKELNKLALILSDSLEKRQSYLNISLKEINKMLILEMLSSVGLDETILKRFPLEFSGGQQQRIGISRAVVLRPKLLVADEPISALDVSIQAQVVNIFNELKKKYNLTILFIAHDLRMVEYISDRIAVMNKGTLLEIGPSKSIVKNYLHPYTRSLLESVPSIESKKGSLIGYVYDASMHKYDKENQPYWHEVGKEHFVLATQYEIKNWKKIKGE